MDTSADPTPETSSRKLKPHQLALGLGGLVASVTVISGIAATVFQFHDDSDTTREVFENIPSAMKLAFYTVLPIIIMYGAVLFSQRMKNWERGGPEARKTTKKNFAQRMKDFRAGVYMQTLLRDPAAGVMHPARRVS